MIYGTADEVVPYQQSEQMAPALEAADVPAGPILIEGVGHRFVGATIGLQREDVRRTTAPVNHPYAPNHMFT
jgi:dipeptidyl aminopeptidase/acylaminoacyl peptidase